LGSTAVHGSGRVIHNGFWLARFELAAVAYVAAHAGAHRNQPGWAIDFATDVSACGQRLRIFSVVDNFTRVFGPGGAVA
jgi:hypothetical protein